MDPQSLKREGFGCKWPAQSWPSPESLSDVCLQEIPGFSCVESLFNGERGAHSNCWEMGRSQGEEPSPALLPSPVSAPAPGSPVLLPEPGRAALSPPSEGEMVCRQSASLCLCPWEAAKPCCHGQGTARSPAWLTSALLRPQQSRRLQDSVLSSFLPTWGCAGDVSSAGPGKHLLVALGHLQSPSRSLCH